MWLSLHIQALKSTRKAERRASHATAQHTKSLDIERGKEKALITPFLSSF
jgi:hypothetical protein